jgi:hypothetical protein
MHDRPETPRREDPHAQLERALIEEYLRSQQHSLETLDQLPPDEAERLLQDASVYASGRLTEVESRAHLVDELHRAPEPVGAAWQAVDAAEAALPKVAAPPRRPAPPAPPRRRPLRWF